MPTQEQQFILLPPRGVRSTAAAPMSIGVRSLLLSLESVKGVANGILAADVVPADVSLTVLDSVHEDGAKLVSLDAESVPALKALQPGVRLVPVVYFRPASVQYSLAASIAAGGVVGVGLRLRVVSGGTKAPIVGATVVAFTDFTARQGASGTTAGDGWVTLNLGPGPTHVDRLYIYPKLGHWGRLRQNFSLTNGAEILLKPLQLGYQDALRHFYGKPAATAGASVKVAVIDTGIDLYHPDLTVSGGENTVLNENAGDFGDNGVQHGTHVAGIIAAHGQPPTGIRGVAPGAEILSYRVYAAGKEQASNFAIIKAIDHASLNGCDVLNLSLGSATADEATLSAIADARSIGTVVIAAAGNDNRSPVSYPAADSLAIAVSAMGRRGTFPSGTIQRGDVKAPFGTDPKNFVADFSNIGSEIDVTGPGVGIISTVPGGYVTMDGTSMATPAVAGIAARILGARPDILSMPRDEARSAAIAGALLTAASQLGFGAIFEGRGLPNALA